MFKLNQYVLNNEHHQTVHSKGSHNFIRHLRECKTKYDRRMSKFIIVDCYYCILSKTSDKRRELFLNNAKHINDKSHFQHLFCYLLTSL